MALPRPSTGLLPAENYSRFGRAFEAIDANAEAVAAARAVADGKAAQADLDAIEEVVAGKADKATLDARRYELVKPQFRPGDAPAAFTLVSDLSQLGGPGDALPAIPAGNIAFGDAGSEVRVRGAGIVASRTAWLVESGRTYAARNVYQRRANPSDPSNDSVRAVLVWLDQAKNVLSVAVVRDDQTLVVADGRREVGARFSRSPGADLIVAPPGACYVRVATQTFGLDGVTGIQVIGWADTTDATLLDPVSADVRADVDGLLSQNFGPRLGEVEALVGTPNSKAFLSKSDAQSGIIPVTVTTVLLLGRTEAGDGYEGRFERISGSPPAGSDTFTNAGQTWIRIPLAGEIALLIVQAALQHLAARGPDGQPTESGPTSATPRSWRTTSTAAGWATRSRGTGGGSVAWGWCRPRGATTPAGRRSDSSPSATSRPARISRRRRG